MITIFKIFEKNLLSYKIGDYVKLIFWDYPDIHSYAKIIEYRFINGTSGIGNGIHVEFPNA